MKKKKLLLCFIILFLVALCILVIYRPLLNARPFSFWKPKCQMKIFGIGIGRTATSSLSYALMQLGFKTWHAPARINRDNIQNYTNKFDALTDLWSVTNMDYKEIYKLYPNAVYILTIRDTEPWLKSTKYYKKLGRISRLIPGYEEMQNKIKLISKDYYENYNKNVLEFFKDKPEKLLVMNITKGDGWDKLGKFFKIETPSLEPFPHIAELYLHFYQCWKYLLP